MSASVGLGDTFIIYHAADNVNLSLKRAIFAPVYKFFRKS